MQRMRIGIDARFYGSLGKGLGRYTEKLIEHLELCDKKNEYIIFLRHENFEEYRPSSKRFAKVLAHYPWYSLREQLFFPILLYQQRLDVIHFPHFNVPLFYRKRFIVTIHDLILLHYPTLRNTTRSFFVYRIKFAAYRLVISSAVRRAAAILTVSRFTESDLIKFYPAQKKKIFVTYEAADQFCSWSAQAGEKALLSRLGLLMPISAHASADDDHDIIRPYFLYVGNAYPHKNLELLIEAAAHFPGHKFVIVGKDDYFYTQLRNKGKEKKAVNVIFAGYATDQELGILYLRAEAYLFPSLYEGFGLPPLEAMNYGLPVISSNRAAMPEILGAAALYFDPVVPKTLYRAIQSIINSRGKRQELQSAGYKRVSRFKWHEMAACTCRVYEETIAKNDQNKNFYDRVQAAENK